MSQEVTIKEHFASEGVIKKFEAILGSPKKAQGFITSLLQIANSNNDLKECTPVSLYTAAATAAVLDLPINQNLGYAWIIAYKNGEIKEAQFQMGYKGFIQLAQRSESYKRLNVVEVYENQFESWNELTEELKADFGKLGTGNVVGFCGYFQLLNGYEKTVYWSKEKVWSHAQRFSKGLNRSSSPWKTDFNAMAMKTVLKNMLSKWGPLSIHMERALVSDQAIIKDVDTMEVTYADNQETEEERARKLNDSTFDEMKSITGRAAGKA